MGRLRSRAKLSAFAPNDRDWSAPRNEPNLCREMRSVKEMRCLKSHPGLAGPSSRVAVFEGRF